MSRYRFLGPSACTFGQTLPGKDDGGSHKARASRNLGARGGGGCSVQLAHHQCRDSPSPPPTHPRRAAPAAIPVKIFSRKSAKNGSLLLTWSHAIIGAKEKLSKREFAEDAGGERRLRARAAAAGGRRGPRPRASPIGGDPSRHSALARCARRARAAPPAPLKAPLGALLAGSVG